MITKSTKCFINLLVAVLLLSVSGCTSEREEFTSQTEGETTVAFAIQLPNATLVTTRALDDADENKISEIDVLVFEPSGGKYVYSARCSGSDISTESGNSSKKTFTVKLRRGNFDLVIVANARSILAETSLTGMTKDAVLSALTTQMPSGGKWISDNTNTDYAAIPMWGNIGDKEINKSTNFTGNNAILLTRMVAKVDVKVDAAVNNFTLTSVHVYNYNTHGAVVPDRTVWDANNKAAIAPTVPSTSTLTEGPLNYDNENGKTEIKTTTNSCENEIYLFESENHTGTDHTTEKDLLDRTCIVVGGIYDTDSDPTYYRVDFSNGSGTSQAFIDVLRNYQYVFNIIRVTGPGYETPEIAFKSEPFNIEVKVVEWNQADMMNVAFDGQNILSVSQNQYYFSRDKRDTEVEDNILYVMTDYTTTASGAKSGWYVDKIVDAADGTSPVTWVTLSPDHGEANNKTKTILKVDENNSLERSAIIWLAAGRLRYAVNVTQFLTSAIGIQILNDSNVPITELVFASSPGIIPTKQKFTVNWQPKEADLMITNTAIGTKGFPDGCGAPVTETIPGGAGTIAYEVSPSAITTNELDESKGGEPFLEKVSKVDFTTTNGTTTTNATIYLRQICYNLLTDVKSYYELNSQTETINVRANFNWKITAVNDPDNILDKENDLINKEGSNNTTTGTPISFKMAAAENAKVGKTATITFENQRDGLEWYVVITAAATDADLYVGRFSGQLKQDAYGVWQFEHALYVQGMDEATQITWSTKEEKTNIFNNTYGKGNTLSLNTWSSTEYPAANKCFQKNDDYISIKHEEDANYNWYLPAQKQLMAIWTVSKSFDTLHKFNSTANYWSATEISTNSYYVNFGTGEVAENSKLYLYWVRCVRDSN